jgi:long-chain fatty acid transport protein
MGTEYSGSSFMAAGSGQTVRSEVGVGRFIVPLVYQVNDKLNIGGSVDFVWATMDLQMALSGAQFADMMPGGTQTYGTAGGSLVTAFGGAVAGGMFNPANPVNWAYFNFSDSGKFSGLAKANGFAEKIGFTYKLNPELTIGGTYHSKTAMGDLTAAAMSVTMNANVDNAILGATWDGQPGGGAHGTPAGTYTAVSVPVTGSITVKNFQWPDTYGLGMAYQASDQLLLVADYKRIGWKAVMKSFNMTFTAGTQTGLATGFSGKVLDATLYQNWEDQNVIELGGAYKTSDALTLRAGVNVANNPVPDKYMNPLFPAIAKSHVTMGAGYAISKSSTLNFDYAYMNKNTVTNGSGVTVDFGGYSAQFLYSHKY